MAANVEVDETRLLYVDYSVELSKKFIMEINNGNEEKREELAKLNFLVQRFLLRRIIDNGFYNYVLEQVLENNDSKKSLKKYILYTESELTDEDKDALFPTELDGGQEIIEGKSRKALLKPPSFLDSIDDYMEKLTYNKEQIMKYLLRLKDEAEEKGDQFKKLAIEEALGVHESDRIITQLLFRPVLPYWYDVEKPPEAYHLLATEFYLRNIAFPYNENEAETSIFSHYGINLKSLYLTDSFVELYLSDIIEPSQSDKYSKLITDSISIASVMWFLRLSLKEKIRLLNSEFPDKFDVESIELRNTSNSLSALVVMGALMLKYGYIDSSEPILKYVLKYQNKLSLDELHVTLDNLATLFREKKEYNLALKYYKKAYDVAGKLNDKRLYHKLVECKNIFETNMKLKNKKESERYLSIINKNINSLSLEDRVGILFNLANAHRRAKDYEKELKIYQLLVEDDKLFESLETKGREFIFKRIETITDYKLNPIKSLDDLKKKEIQEEYNQFIMQAHILMDSLQFEKAMDFLKRANELLPEQESYLQTLGALYYRKGDYKKSLEILKKRNKIYKPDPVTNFNIAVMELSVGERDKAVEEVSLFFSNNMRQFPKLMSLLIVNLLYNKNEGVIPIIAQKTAEKIEYHNQKEELYLLVSELLMAHNLLSLSRKCLSNILGGNTNTELYQKKALLVKGELEFLSGNYLQSLKTYISLIDEEETKKDPELRAHLYFRISGVLYNMGFSFIAREFLKVAAQVNNEFEQAYIASESMENSIGIRGISENILMGKSRKFFLSAERQFFSLRKEEKNDMDVSTILSEYGKGVEVLISEYSQKLLTDILREKGMKNIENISEDKIPLYLKSLQKKTQLGHWVGVFYLASGAKIKGGKVNGIRVGKTKEEYNKEYGQKFINKLKSSFSSDELEFMAQTLRKIVNIRNSSAHHADRDIEKVSSERRDMLENVNKLILVFAGLFNLISLAESIK